MTASEPKVSIVDAANLLTVLGTSDLRATANNVLEGPTAVGRAVLLPTSVCEMSERHIRKREGLELREERRSKNWNLDREER